MVNERRKAWYVFMDEFKIAADSSGDLAALDGLPFSAAPLKISIAGREFVDDKNLDVDEMVEVLSASKGRSSTSCPNVEDWLKAFGDAKYIFCVTISSKMSGSFNSAVAAKQIYEELYPDRQVLVIDSLTTGPEMRLIIEKIAEYISSGDDFDLICKKISKYMKSTRLVFMLESIKNLAENGRVSSIVAKAVGLLGIRIIGRASEAGEFDTLDKSRGSEKSIRSIVNCMKKIGLKGSKVYIAHCNNERVAERIKDLICEEFAKCEVIIYKCGGLCSFYAEAGGLLVGFET